MKISQGLNLISNWWVSKPKEFRVRYQKRINSKLVTDHSPGLENAALDSDVTAWRYAWKLFKATEAQSKENVEEELVNITVVDDSDNPIIYYVKGKNFVFNLKNE